MLLCSTATKYNYSLTFTLLSDSETLEVSFGDLDALFLGHIGRPKSHHSSPFLSECLVLPAVLGEGQTNLFS
jgi:hypothetical protein